jgi:hypothetical protein
MSRNGAQSVLSLDAGGMDEVVRPRDTRLNRDVPLNHGEEIQFLTRGDERVHQ